MAASSKKLMEPFHPHAVELATQAKEGKLLGIGTCHLNPSGCFDIAKGFSAKFSNVPVIRIHFHEADKTKYVFLDKPPANSSLYEGVYFVGCITDFGTKFSILKKLAESYRFTSVKYVYDIYRPEESDESNRNKYQPCLVNESIWFARSSPYQFRILHTGLNINFGWTIGIPRFELKASTFNVPEECFGLMRDRFMGMYLTSPNYELNRRAFNYIKAYFSQVARAGEESKTKPVTVMALGLKPDARAHLSTIAESHSIKIDFCDHLPNCRLPHQADFFHVLETMKRKKGAVAIDCLGSQSFLQALSFGSPATIFSAKPNKDGPHFFFFQQVVSLVPKKYEATARVIVGLSDDYTLLNNRAVCETVYEQLQSTMDKAHHQFEAFSTCTETLAEEKIVSTVPSKSKLFERSLGDNLLKELKRITALDWTFSTTDQKAYLTLQAKELQEIIFNCLRQHRILIEKSNLNGTNSLSIDVKELKISQLKNVPDWTLLLAKQKKNEQGQFQLCRQLLYS